MWYVRYGSRGVGKAHRAYRYLPGYYPGLFLIRSWRVHGHSPRQLRLCITMDSCGHQSRRKSRISPKRFRKIRSLSHLFLPVTPIPPISADRWISTGGSATYIHSISSIFVAPHVCMYIRTCLAMLETAPCVSLP